MHSINERESEIARILESKEARFALEKHLDEIVDGVGFRGSQRSGQFLRYIVEQAVAGRFDALKERAIGIELFGRAPSYDTGEDAIVRVTASDVRKRLLQHYGSCETVSEFRISLPLGSYVPEIVRERHGDGPGNETREPHADGHGATTGTVPASAGANVPSPAPSEPAQAEKNARLASWSAIRWFLIVGLILAAGLAVAVMELRTTQTGSTVTPVLPWSAFFASAHPTHLITSDPDIAGIERLTGGGLISVSDYANHNYVPEGRALQPGVRSIVETFMRGDKAATVDTQIAVNIAALAQNSGKRIDVQGARYIQFSNLKTDDNFIFLGSPRTDPWFSLFNDKLDFEIVVDPSSGEEIVRNAHPMANEQAEYVPTAKGGATGTSYAVIAFVQNPDQNGQVLLLAGLNAEGTQATGKLVTDILRLTATLKLCGIAPASAAKHFELLLSVKTMASLPSEFSVVACHTRAGAAL